MRPLIACVPLRDDVAKAKASLTECENEKAEEARLKDKVDTPLLCTTNAIVLASSRLSPSLSRTAMAYCTCVRARRL